MREPESTFAEHIRALPPTAARLPVRIEVTKRGGEHLLDRLKIELSRTFRVGAFYVDVLIYGATDDEVCLVQRELRAIGFPVDVLQ